MRSYKGYEAVVGLEIHVELRTKRKAFCSCSAEYGGERDTHVCPVCMGMPGATPVINPEAVKFALRAGLALGCEISRISRFDRKHYFYPDLPKGYQITQFYEPLCRDGELEYELDGQRHAVRIERIHLEEDAGRLSYSDGKIKIDNNRCGVPLAEIVTSPDMTGGEEAMAFVRELRRRLLFAGVSDCRMNEGSLRCDVNVSVRPVGEKSLGNRCEIKNINSIAFIGRAVDAELVRQTELLASGESITVQTRRFNEDTGKTEYMRDKETAADYRYIRETELPAVITDAEYVEFERSQMPPSPSEREARLSKLSISNETAAAICRTPETADYFDECLRVSTHPDTAAKLYVSEVIPAMTRGESFADAVRLAECADMLAEGEINNVSAKKCLQLCVEEDSSARDVARRHGLFIIRDRETILELARKAFSENARTVSQVLGGKESAKKALVGAVMRSSGGRADAKLVAQCVDELTEAARREK